MHSSENLKFLDNMVMTTKNLMPYNRPQAFYSLAAHITSITTFHSSRPGFPPVSFFLPSLSFSPSHLPSFLTCHCIRFYFQIKVMKWIFTEVILYQAKRGLPSQHHAKGTMTEMKNRRWKWAKTQIKEAQLSGLLLTSSSIYSRQLQKKIHPWILTVL